MSVFWTRGYRREGSALQMGLVVVRPGCVSFLPIRSSRGGSAAFRSSTKKCAARSVSQAHGR
jgi:hypothetical protein